MNTFERLQIARFYVEAWTDGDDNRISILIDRADDAPGKRRVWFFLGHGEIDTLIAQRGGQFEDGYHRMSVIGDSTTFYDLELPNSDAGTFEVKFLRLHIPRALWKYMRRLASVVWRGQRAALAAGADKYDVRNRTQIDIDAATYERFATRYHHGAGQVVLDASERLLTEMPRRPGLKKCVERMEQVARNTTRNVYQTARLSVSNDWDGYYFRAITPAGRCAMNGGIVNHARHSEENDWSIHT